MILLCKNNAMLQRNMAVREWRVHESLRMIVCRR